MLHPTLFPVSLHAIDISDMNSYDIVKPSLIASVESDLMNHLHGLSTFLTSNNSETWHRTCVDACQSWQRPRGYTLYKQPANEPNKQTQNNSQMNGPRCKSVPICQGHSVWPSPGLAYQKHVNGIHFINNHLLSSYINSCSLPQIWLIAWYKSGTDVDLSNTDIASWHPVLIIYVLLSYGRKCNWNTTKWLLCVPLASFWVFSSISTTKQA